MRREVRWGPLVLFAVLAFGCDSDDPLLITDQDAELVITANSAQVPGYRVWYLTEDSDGVPGPDDVNGDGVDGDVSLWCELDGVAIAESVPWTYSVRVEVLREGETVAEQLTSVDAELDSFNRAAYDTSEANHGNSHPPIDVVHQRGACSGNGLIVCNPQSASTICTDNGAGICEVVYSCSGDFDTLCDPTNPGTTCSSQGAGFCTPAGVCSGDPAIACEPTCGELGYGDCLNDIVTRRMIFDNSGTRRRLSEANYEVLSAGPNFITDACEADIRCEAKVESDLGAFLDPPLGECPAPTLGDSALDPATPDLNADPLIFGFDLRKGDTVIVQARRSNTIPGGGQIIEFLQVPGIRGRLFIDGALLQEDEVTGNTSSPSTDPSPNISFSFTSK